MSAVQGPDASGGVSSERIAQFAVGLEWNSVPSEVKARVRAVLADTIGTMIAGSRTEAARLARVLTPARTAESGGPLARGAVAMSLGTAASALDFDDGHVEGGGIHPSGVIVAALVSAADGLEASGEDLAAAYLAGYEAAVRAGLILYPQTSEATYHCAGTAGCIGAALAVARLRGYGSEVARRALEIASAYAPMSGFGLPMVKEAMGWGALTAVTSADLAGAGFNSYPGGGRPGSVPAAFGYPTPFDDPTWARRAFVTSIGADWQILGGYLKPYASCRLTHAAADALIALIKAESIEVDAIEDVRVRTIAPGAELDDVAPASLEHAQYSIPFVLAAILVLGGAGVAEISERSIGDARVLARARDIRVEHDTDLDSLYPAHYPAEVMVRLTNGTELSESRVDIRGEPAAPMTDAELREKFLTNAAFGLDADNAGRCWQMYAELDKMPAAELGIAMGELIRCNQEGEAAE